MRGRNRERKVVSERFREKKIPAVSILLTRVLPSFISPLLGKSDRRRRMQENVGR